MNISAGSTVQLGLGSTLFLCQIKFQLHVWLEQETEWQYMNLDTPTFGIYTSLYPIVTLLLCEI